MQKAIFQSKRLNIALKWPRIVQSDSYTANPLGLVLSEESWYLVALIEHYARVYPLSLISETTVLNEHFQRPESFDLSAFWSRWKRVMAESRPAFPAVMEIVPSLANDLGERVFEDVPALIRKSDRDGEGRIRVAVTFASLSAARSFALANGSAVKIVEPKGLLLSVLDSAEQTLSLYGGELDYRSL
jgi:predicted DNA-binding transcriptional regulator YafY